MLKKGTKETIKKQHGTKPYKGEHFKIMFHSVYSSVLLFVVVIFLFQQCINICFLMYTYLV
jgi:hypothetical protein